MAIMKSQLELAELMADAIAEVDETQLKLLAWYSEMIDRDCFHCGEDIGNTDRPFLWFGTVYLVMHPACLIDWLGRVLRDAKQVRDEMSNVERGV